MSGSPVRAALFAAAVLMVGSRVSSRAAAQEADLATRMKAIDATIARGPFAATWPSLETHSTPAWYADAKFGIFIHWGLYCVPAYGSEWYPRNMYEKDSDTFRHHVEKFGPHARFGYKDFLPQFTAEKFDADAWADLFARAGAKFVVPVAEHHDGFAMYDCSLSEWDASEKGPRKDIVGLLASAVKKRGLTFGVSSHRAEHWWFFNGARAGGEKAFASDVADPKFAALYGPAEPENVPPSKEFLDDWLARTCELVDKYRPELVWFDWWIEQPAFESYRRRFAAYYYDRAATWHADGTGGGAINYKNASFPERAAVLDLERGQLARIRPLLWQTDTSISKNSWGYVVPQDYKTATSIVGDLVDIVSKNGCLLLNIGPKPDGTIAEPEQQILLAIGRWLAVNGDAIYGTRPTRLGFGEGPTGVPEGGFSDTARNAFTSSDLRFTQKRDASGRETLYVTVLAWPDDGKVTIHSLASEAQQVSDVALLGGDAKPVFLATSAGLVVELPKKPTGEHAWVLAIHGLKELAWDGRIRPAVDGTLTLKAADATVHGTSARYETGGGKDNIGFWDDARDTVSWSALLGKAGAFDVAAIYACEAGHGGRFRVNFDAKNDAAAPAKPSPVSLLGAARATGGWTKFVTVELGRVELATTGEVAVSVVPQTASSDDPPWRAINLQAVILRPVTR